MSIIKDLKIENDDYTIINSLNKDWLMNLSRVNIFVGASNTGKSRFMRSLFYVDKDYALKFLPNDPQFETFLKQSEEFKKSINKKNGFLDSQDQRRAKSNILKSLHGIEFIEEATNPWPDLIRIYSNSDNDFKGESGIVYRGTKFYLAGKVELSALTDDDKDGVDADAQNRVFTQDHTTKISMKVKSLAKAYNVMPNIQSGRLEVGIEINLKWAQATPQTIVFEE